MAPGAAWGFPCPVGMDSFLYDVRAALRRLPKTPWFTLAVVMTLAVATGANTLIFSVARVSCSA